MPRVTLGQLMEAADDSFAVASFPGGVPGEISENDISFSMFRPTMGGSAHQRERRRAIAAQTSVARFEGENCDDEARDACAYVPHYAVGIFNGKDKLSLLFSQKRLAFTVHQLPNTSLDEAAKDKKAKGANAREARAELIEAFGSQKKRRGLSVAKANALDTKTGLSVGSVKNALSLAAEASVRRDEEREAREFSDSRLPPYAALLPGIDLTAQNARAIYAYTGMVPQQLHAALKDNCKALEKAAKRARKQPTSDLAKLLGEQYGSLCIRLVDAARKASDATEREVRSRCALLMGVLVCLMKRRSKGFSKRQEMLHFVQFDSHNGAPEDLSTEMPEELQLWLEKRFVERARGRSLRFSKSSLNALVMWACILALHASGTCHLDHDLWQQLGKDLGLTTSKIRTFFQQIGARLSSPAATNTSLRLPSKGEKLRFPGPGIGGKRRRGR
ncbi:MAG: hypothetical protein MHM6MM_001496 [Cercozoa sp. M6MM]